MEQEEEEDIEEALSDIRELEIIFSKPDDIIILQQMTSLERLVYIDNRLDRMPDLRVVGSTLSSLTITKQCISRIEFLMYLPHLQELFLHNNEIRKIENLGSCARLRRLSLCENYIDVLEGLENLAELRDLRLASNRIHHINGLEHNRLLESLDLSNNLITSLEFVESLKGLVHLRNLSLSNELFGSNPVSKVDEYRTFVICSLKQITSLDEILIENADRKLSEDYFLRKAMDFNERVEAMRKNQLIHIRHIQAERHKDMEQAQHLKQQLLKRFSDLQEVVCAGRLRIKTEQAKQLQIREKNFVHLKEQLFALKQEHNELLRSLMDQESLKAKQEERIISRIRMRARFELEESVAVSELLHSTKPVAFQYLFDNHSRVESISAELKALCEILQDPQQDQDEFQLFRASKIYSPVLFDAHMNRIGDDMAGDNTTAVDVYVPIRSFEVLIRWLRSGELQPDAQSTSYVLWTDPKQAFKMYNGQNDQDFRIVIRCRLVLSKVTPLSNVPDIKDIETIRSSCELLSGGKQAVYINFKPKNRNSNEVSCYVIRAGDESLLCPEMYLVFSTPETFDEKEPQTFLSQYPSLDTLIRRVSEKAENDIAELVPSKVQHKLDSIEKQIKEAVEHYESHIARGIDPQAAAALARKKEEVQKLEKANRNVRRDIDSAKSRQEKLLRDYSAAR